MTAEIAVPDHTPEVMTLFDIPTPDIEEKLAVAVHKLPPIPTPPVIVKSPVVVEVDAVPEVIAIPEANVLTPNKVWEALETKPTSLEAFFA